MRTLINNREGFGLVELMVVLVVIGFMVGLAMQSATVVNYDVRTAETERELELLASAIVGDPGILQDGMRSDFGYVGDVGAFPPNLSALYTNPGGTPTWNGPYIKTEFAQDTVSYRLDAWGQPYTYGGGTVITSTGGSGTITKKLADASSDYLLNQVHGTVKDKNDSLPGAIYKDSVDIKVEMPLGGSGTITKTYHPDAAGDFTSDSIPAGSRLFRFIYRPANDTVRRYFTVLPRQQVSRTLDVKFAAAYFGGGSSPSSLVLRPTGTGSETELDRSSCSQNWDCVNESSPDEDGTYVNKADGSYKDDSYQMQNHGAVTGTIDSMVITIRVRRYGWGNNRQVRTVLRTNSQFYYGPNIDMDGVTNYTDFTRTYATNPNTGSAWTWSQIDAMEVGVGIKKASRCTQVFATVYYH
ncbi:MAG: prepilin-type N-terminal cleavage/methylation domain-containing protein [Candidatus Zixiibacteriota bacterium]